LKIVDPFIFFGKSEISEKEEKEGWESCRRRRCRSRC